MGMHENDSVRNNNHDTKNQLLKEILESSLKTKECLEKVKFLCEESDIRPSQKEVNEALEYLLNGSEVNYSKKWKLIAYFCQLTSDCKPDQQLIDRVLTFAPQLRIFNLVRQLVKLDQDNAPSQTAVENALLTTAKQKPLFGETCTPLEAVRACCESSVNKPSQKTVTEALEYQLSILDTKKHNEWGLIVYFCQLSSECKPDQQSIEHTLAVAMEHDHVALVELLCKLDTDNAPSKEAIERTLKKAATQNEHYSYKIFKACCGTATHKPSKEAVNEVCQIAVDKHQWHSVQYLCSLPSLIGPSQELIEYALKKMAERRGDPVAKECLIELKKRLQHFQQVSNQEAKQSQSIDVSENQADQTNQQSSAVKPQLSAVRPGRSKIANEQEIISAVERKINGFVVSYSKKHPGLKAELTTFQKEAKKVLDREASIEDKKQNLINLAHASFHHRHLVLRVILDISQFLFLPIGIPIMLYRSLGLGISPLFSLARTNRETFLTDDLLTSMVEEDNQNDLSGRVEQKS